MSIIFLYIVFDYLVIIVFMFKFGMVWVEQCLGVFMVLCIGGQYVWLGMYNVLLLLGEGFYFEVIIIDFNVDVFEWLCWFGMDYLGKDVVFCLVYWVVCISDIVVVVVVSFVLLGVIEFMSCGVLDWFIIIVVDGMLVCEGVMLFLIQWFSQLYLVSVLFDWGCCLQ